MRRVLTWLNRGLLLPLLALILLLLGLLFTQPGLRLSIYVAEKALPALQVAEVEGAWLSGASFRQLTYQDPQFQLSAQELSLRLQKRCLVQFRVCIPEIKVAGLQLNQRHDVPPAAPNDSTELVSEPASAAGLGIAFPVPVRIDRLILDQIEIALAEQHLAWQHFSIGVNAWGNRLQLSQGRWHGLKLILPEASASEPVNAYIPPVLPEIRLPFSIYLDDFQLTELQFMQGEVQQQLQRANISAQLTPQQIRILDLQLEHSAFQAQAAANVQLSQHFPLNARFDLQLADNLLSGQRVQGELSGDLARLLLTLNSSGPVTLTAQAEAALLSADLPLQLNVGATTLSWPLTEPQYQLSDTSLQLTGSLSDLQLQLDSTVNATALPEAKLSLTANWRHWQQQALITNLSLQILQGEVQAQGELALSPMLSWQLKLALSEIAPEQYWPEFPGRLNGELELAGQYQPEQGLQLSVPQLALQGELRQLPLRLQGALELSGEQALTRWQFSSPGLQLQHGSNQLSLRGQLAEDWQLDSNLNFPDLAQSHPGLAGKLQGTASLRGAAATPKLELQLSAERLVFADARLRAAELTASVDLARQWQTELSLMLRQGRWQQQRLQQLDLNLSGNQQQHQLKLALQADELNTALTATGSLEPGQQWQGSLDQASITSLLGEWRLTAPLAIVAMLPEQRLTLDRHCWQQESASLCLIDAANISAGQVNAALQLSDYPLQKLNSLLPLQSSIDGVLQAKLDLSWQVNQAPTAVLSVQAPQGRFVQQLDVPVTLPWQQLEFNAELAAHQLRSHLSVQLSNSGQLQAQALVSDLDQSNRPLRAELTLSDLTLEFLKPLLDEYSELSGQVSSRLSVDGSLAEPQVQGEFRLADLRVKGKLAPTDIEQADLVLSFRGERAELEGLVKTPEGQIELVGLANWQDLAAWDASLAVSGDQLKLQIPQAELYLKPDLRLDAAPGRARLSGVVQIPRAAISVDSLPQNAVGLSDDHILLDRRLQPVSDPQAAQFAIETDIRVQLGPRVRLEAFGLKSRLAGELRVQQQQFNPTVRGEVSLVDGTFRAYGQDLLIRQGKLTFNGPADQPFLNVEAIRNPANMEDDVIAGIRVTGPADEPVVAIFSEPAKPQANALSYLIMGKDLDSESGFNANSVTTSLIGMSISSSGKLVGEIGEAFGVSDLMLDTEGAGDNSQVTVSGYLTRDLQLKYGIGIFQPIGQFTLRYRLLRNLYLEAVSGLDNAVDLLYKFEFD